MSGMDIDRRVQDSEWMVVSGQGCPEQVEAVCAVLKVAVGEAHHWQTKMVGHIRLETRHDCLQIEAIRII